MPLYTGADHKVPGSTILILSYPISEFNSDSVSETFIILWRPVMASKETDQAEILEKTVTSRNIDHLPSELLFMICVYLEPIDVAGVRLLNRTIAVVGLEYLVFQIHLIPKPDSFDRLLAVAEHPIASRYVTSLFYEADLLRTFRLPQNDRENWEKTIAGPCNAGLLEESQDPHFKSACDRPPKKYIRRPSTVALNHNQHYTKRELQQAYEKYRSYRAEQRRMNN